MNKILLTASIVIAFSVATFAQTPTTVLTGRVTDQTGAVIPQATVTVTGPDGKQATTTTDQEGSFEIHSLIPGSYTVAAVANGFAAHSEGGVTLSAGQTQKLNLTLQIQTKP